MVIYKTGIDGLIPKLRNFKIPMLRFVVGVIKGKVLHIVEIGIGLFTPIFSNPYKVDAGPLGVVLGLLAYFIRRLLVWCCIY